MSSVSVSWRVCGLSQACKPHPGASGGAHGSGQSLPPHVSPLDQSDDQSSPAKRKRTASPAKVCASFFWSACLWYNGSSDNHFCGSACYSSELHRVLDQQFSTATNSKLVPVSSEAAGECLMNTVCLAADLFFCVVTHLIITIIKNVGQDLILGIWLDAEVWAWLSKVCADEHEHARAEFNHTDWLENPAYIWLDTGRSS